MATGINPPAVDLSRRPSLKEDQKHFSENDTELLLKDIGALVRSYRKKQNNSQETLAEDAGVTIDVIKRIEAGKPVSGINLARVLAEASLLRLSDDRDLYAMLKGMRDDVAALKRELLKDK